MWRRIARVAGVAVLASTLAATAWAQGGTASISGTVFDQDKAVLPGAVVTATNDATGIARETVTGTGGAIRHPHPPSRDLHDRRRAGRLPDARRGNRSRFESARS